MKLSANMIEVLKVTAKYGYLPGRPSDWGFLWKTVNALQARGMLAKDGPVSITDAGRKALA